MLWTHAARRARIVNHEGFFFFLLAVSGPHCHSGGYSLSANLCKALQPGQEEASRPPSATPALPWPSLTENPATRNVCPRSSAEAPGSLCEQGLARVCAASGLYEAALTPPPAPPEAGLWRFASLRPAPSSFSFGFCPKASLAAGIELGAVTNCSSRFLLRHLHCASCADGCPPLVRALGDSQAASAVL